MTWSTDPSTNVFKKSPPSPNSTTRSSNLLYCGWMKKKLISFFYNQHVNKITPHFTFMRRSQKTDTHALQQHRLSQNIFPVCSSFVLVIASDKYVKPESEKRTKNVYFHTTKNIQIQSTLFRYFLTNSYHLTSDLFTVVWPVVTTPLSHDPD